MSADELPGGVEVDAPAATEAFEAELARGRSRRLIVVGGVAVALVAALVAYLVFGKQRGADPEKLGKVRAAMSAVRPIDRPDFAAVALAELAAGRAAPELVAALKELQLVSSREAGLVAARALVRPGVLDVLVAACPKGPEALAAAIQAAPPEQEAIFCAACTELCARLPPHRIGARAGLLALAAVVAESLARSGGLDPTEAELAAWLLEGE